MAILPTGLHIPLLVLVGLPACGAAPAAAPVPLASGPGAPLAAEVPLSYGEIAADTALYMALMEAEDRRAPAEVDLEIFRRAFLSPHAGIRRAAVRGWGRLERPVLAAELVPLLSDPIPAVRAEAANAFVQAVRPAGGAGAAEPRIVLSSRLETESDDLVRSALLRSIGRLPVSDSAAAASVAAVLVDASRTPGVSPTVLLGVARGARSLYRTLTTPGGASGATPGAASTAASGDGLTRRLEEIALDASLPAEVRRAAVTARTTAGTTGAVTLSALLDDPDAGVRRLAAGAVAALPAGTEGAALLERALGDPASEVRLAAVPVWGRLLQSIQGCGPLLPALDDPVDLVALAALEALAAPCPGGEEVTGRLSAIAAALPDSGDAGWHRPARAFLSLARADPAAAPALLARFMAHPSPFVRAHAARGAGALGDMAALESLAGDPNDNVRQAAVTALAQLAGRAADPVLIAQLERDDPQLLMTAARLLQGTRSPEAVPALFRALDRLTSLTAPTTRDARAALLTRIGELGAGPDAGTLAPRLEGYLSDIDPAIAARAAATLEAWTGRPGTPNPAGFPTLPTPTLAELRDLENTRYRIEMASGASFVIRLLPFEAPATAARFARMARDGVFDGLTFHRVAPNFVIQGGSPGANEYSGHGEYSRDETGLIGHWKGTLGISTRGRDTGDGQIFVNLVDNHRLDHDYTVFGEIVEGADAPATVLEGAVITGIRRVGP